MQVNLAPLSVTASSFERAPATATQKPSPARCRAARTVAAAQHETYDWDLSKDNINEKGVKQLPISSIRRPLQRTRTNDKTKVEALMDSISKHGLKEPIDILDLEGQGEYFGFSGCHRFEACQRLGMETIACRVRRVTKATLRMHFL